MNFLGMGPMELMVILVLALIVLGPAKLPEIAGQIGRVVRDFRRMTGDLSSEFNRTLSLEIEERKAAESGAPPPPPPSVNPYDTATAEVTTPTPPPYEPSEAPPAPVAVTTTSNGTTVEAPPAEPVVAEAPKSRRRTIDPDLAPPY